MLCPRKLENTFSSKYHADSEDCWRAENIFKNEGLDKHCSYCGSLHPQVFLNLVEKGAELIPTDKNYKAYIKFKDIQTKFYFQHLSKEDINRYIDLAEKRKINFSYPGFYYKKPYFLCKRQINDVVAF